MNCSHADQRIFFCSCQDGQVGGGPGIHALVIGVSNYSSSDEDDKRRARKVKPIFADIPGVAVGAIRFAQYLKSGFGSPRSVPLHTVRLLLSPVDDETRYLPEFDRWKLAEFWNVVDALEDWSTDCDSHSDNLAVLYIAGHGAVTGEGAQNVFLSEANRIRDRYAASVNLAAVQKTMKSYKAKSNLYIFDCCAQDENKDLPDFTGSPGIGIPWLGSSGGKRDYWTRINAARVGTSTNALGAKDGTLLSWALMPLLMSAGEIIRNRFTVTTQRLDAELLPAMSRWRRVTIPGDGGPTVAGENDPLGITCPTPPPNFKISLINDLTVNGGTVIFTITDPGTGKQIKVNDDSPPSSFLREAMM